MSTSALNEVSLARGSLVIADLHLDAAEIASCKLFTDWLQGLEPVPSLAILGDLFDVWVGPAQGRMPGAALVLDTLAALVQRGTSVLVVPGNRDFLLDASFEARTGATIQREGFVGLVGDPAHPSRALFIHGDTLCTLDHGYQRLRKSLHSAPMQWLAPRLPLWMGTKIAKRLRRASVNAIAQKLPEEKSVQESAVRALAAEHEAGVVVCGHAHAFRDVALDHGPRWIVLDAFGGEHDLARIGENGAITCEWSGVGKTLQDSVRAAGLHSPRAR